MITVALGLGLVDRRSKKQKIYTNNFWCYCTFVPLLGLGLRATVKFSAVFFHDESSVTIGGYESAIASNFFGVYDRAAIMDLLITLKYLAKLAIV